MIFVAIGHLLVLVEEAPENWQSFFDDIYGELNQWSSQNRKSLESLKLHTQTSAELIQSLRLLISSLTASDEKSNRMLADAQQLRVEVEQYRQTLGLGIGEQQASRQPARQHQPTPQRSQLPHKSADLDIER